MNQIATINQEQRAPVRSVLIDMATRFGMEPAAFEATVRATCIQKASREEFAAFLLVAKEYGLNPLTKEIYAFPAKGGGIVPVVSIDGWINLINSHKACDGFEFEMEHGEDGGLISCTCRMFRKDRGRPVVVTEYLSECVRNTEPWKMRHRMLRHKSLIQAGRYAFGFSGIYDEDEAAKIAEARYASSSVTVDTPPAPPLAIAAPRQVEDVPATPTEEMITAAPPAEMVIWDEPEAEAADEPPAPPPGSGSSTSIEGSGAATSSAPSSNGDGARAKAAPPQDRDSDAGGAAQPNSRAAPGALTGQSATTLRDRLLADVRQLATMGDFLSWARDARVHIDRLPADMAQEVNTEFQRCQGNIGGKS